MKVETALTTTYHNYKNGKVMKTSIKITLNRSTANTTRFVTFFLTNRVGGLSIRQSRALGGLNIRRTSFAKSWFLISETRSIGDRPIFSSIVFDAPRNRINLTARVFPLWSTNLTAKCRGVSPSTSWASNFGFQASKYPSAISDCLKHAQCNGVEPRLSAVFMSRPISLKK